MLQALLRRCLGGLLLLATWPARADDPAPTFTTWDDQFERASDLFVADVVPRPGVAEPKAVRQPLAGPITSEVRILFVLRGSAQLGRASVRASFDPGLVPRFLFLGVDLADQCGPRTPGRYFGERQFAILPLPASFEVASLSGRLIEAQLRLLLQHRRRELQSGRARSTGDLARLPRQKQIEHIRRWLSLHRGRGDD